MKIYLMQILKIKEHKSAFISLNKEEFASIIPQNIFLLLVELIVELLSYQK